jgi:hypothetical protein
MALVGNLPADQNEVHYTFPSCYMRIIDVTQENNVNGLTFIKANFYADAAARAVNAVPVVGKIYNCPTVDFPAVTPMAAAGYEYLKTLPEFAGWVDA